MTLFFNCIRTYAGCKSVDSSNQESKVSYQVLDCMLVCL